MFIYFYYIYTYIVYKAVGRYTFGALRNFDKSLCVRESRTARRAQRDEDGTWERRRDRARQRAVSRRGEKKVGSGIAIGWDRGKWRTRQLISMCVIYREWIRPGLVCTTGKKYLFYIERCYLVTAFQSPVTRASTFIAGPLRQQL